MNRWREKEKNSTRCEGLGGVGAGGECKAKFQSAFFLRG